MFLEQDYFVNGKTVRSNDRYTHFGVAAARLAIEDAKLDIQGSSDATRLGVIVGSAFGGMETYETQTLKLAASGPKGFPLHYPCSAWQYSRWRYRHRIWAEGPNCGVVSACATASHAMGEAMAAIRRGDTDVMITGGCEAAITPTSFAGFCSMKAMCTNFNDNPTKGEIESWQFYHLHVANFTVLLFYLLRVATI